MRKANFSPAEIPDVTEKFDENMDILQSNCTNTITNAKKDKLWEEITEPYKRDRKNARELTAKPRTTLIKNLKSL